MIEGKSHYMMKYGSNQSQVKKDRALLKVRVTYTIAGAWGKLTYQPCFLPHFTATSHKMLKKDIKMGEHKGSKSQTLKLINFNKPLCFRMNKPITSG